MYKLFYSVFIVLFSCVLAASEQSSDIQQKKLVWILDRQVYGRQVPAGKLYAIMGAFESSMFECIASVVQNVPVLVSIHVLKNILITEKNGITGRRPMANKKLIETELNKIPEEIQKTLLLVTNSEISRAWDYVHAKGIPSFPWLCGESAKRLRGYKFRESLKDKSYIYYSKNPNLQLVLILPKGSFVDPMALLRSEGFSEAEFNLIEPIEFDKFMDSESGEWVGNTAEPFNIDAFRGLFFADPAVRRNIFLNGHGNNGKIAQLSIESFKKCVQYFGEIGCNCLAISSCYAGSEEHRQAYLGAPFLIMVFSVGDLVCYSHGWRCHYDSFFNFLQVYEQKGCLEDPYPLNDSEALQNLFEAVKNVHLDPTNYPWFYFPKSSGLVHLSQLMGSWNNTKVVEPSNVTMPVIVTTTQPVTSPVAINKFTGSITQEDLMNSKILHFDNMVSLLLHVQSVTVPVKISKVIPMIVSMINVPFHYFEHLDIGRIYLKDLLNKVALLKKVVVVKELKCANYQDSGIADNVSGQPLVIERMLVTHVMQSGRVLMLKALFNITSGAWCMLHAYVDDNSCGSGDPISAIVNVDLTQEIIRSKHEQVLRYLIDGSSSDEAAKLALQRMFPVESSAPQGPIKRPLSPTSDLDWQPLVKK